MFNKKIEGQTRMGKERVKDSFDQLEVFKLVGPDEIYHGIHIELVGTVSAPLVIIFENLWRTVKCQSTEEGQTQYPSHSTQWPSLVFKMLL